MACLSTVGLLAWLVTWIGIGCESATVTVTLRDTDRVPLAATPTFICVTSDPGQSKQPVITKWTKGPNQPLPNDPTRYRPSKDKKYLSILSVKKSEEGWYYCHAETASGQAISGKANLYVIVPPTVTPLDGVVLENRTAVVGCHGRDFYVVFWNFRGVQLDGPRYRKDGKKAENVTILQAKRSDSGTYTCIASNERYRAMAHPVLVVEYPPEILKGPEDADVRPSYDARLQCNVTGEPRPTVSWQHNNENLDFTRDRRYLVEEQGGVHTLTIENTKTSDSGRYKCLVSNKYGSVSPSAKLTVGWGRDPPKVYKTIEHLQNDTLDPRVVGLVNPVITWSKDGKEINYEESIGLAIQADGTLVITNAQYEDSGLYTWKVSSPSVQTQQQIVVTVRGRPYVPQNVTAQIITTTGDLSSNPSILALIAVNWTAPEFDGNSAITDYEVRCRHVTFTAWTVMPASRRKRGMTMECVNSVGEYEVVVVAANDRGRNASKPYKFIYEPADPVVSVTPSIITWPSTGTWPVIVGDPRAARDGEGGISITVVIGVVAAIVTAILVVVACVIIGFKWSKKRGRVVVNGEAGVPRIETTPVLQQPAQRHDASFSTPAVTGSPYSKRRPRTLSTTELLRTNSSTSESVQPSSPSPVDGAEPITIAFNNRQYSKGTAKDSPSDSYRSDMVMESISEVHNRINTQASCSSDRSDEVFTASCSELYQRADSVEKRMRSRSESESVSTYSRPEIPV